MARDRASLRAAGLAAAALVVLLPLLAVGGAGAGVTTAAAAHLGIPLPALAAYHQAAAAAPGVAPGCRVRWSILAGIGQVESGHGTHGGAAVGPDGRVLPPIIGPALDGSPGLRALPDTDDGRWDGDPTWDRAVGPLQFIPSSWRTYGQDADGDGTADPHHMADAALAAAAHLCRAAPGDYRQEADLHAALLAYNASAAYAAEVRSWIRHYDAVGADPAAAGVGGYHLPVARSLVTPALLARPHHDYPAWDFATPVGTPVVAVHGGTVVRAGALGACGLGVVVQGDDGHRYTYCHASALDVATGNRVTGGQRLLASGNTGRSTGPHLHLGIRVAGTSVCPQTLLQAWYDGTPASPASAPRTGCFY